jgi:Site-specific recombinase XerD
LKHNFINKAQKLPGDIKGESRMRTYSKAEMNLMFDRIIPFDFNRFVQFAYYTGARSGEIRSISEDNIFNDRLVSRGKTGRRVIKLNTQAQNIIDSQNKLWNYSKDYVSHKFKKEVRRLGIKNARFHDLRRTFGLNLIKQGMSIYKVSKLLGHRSVKTTEQHYAPLLTVEIEDFKL